MDIHLSYGQSIKLQYNQLNDFQGDLKDLSNESYMKLRAEILATGFAFAPHIWQNPSDQKWYLVDGHQRIKTLKRMIEEEGCSAPEILCVPVQADTFKDAKRRVLQAASQYGKVTEEGLKQFLVDADFKVEEFESSFVFPEIKMPSFIKEHFRKESDPKDEALPETPRVARSRRGDLFCLGKHRLLCGDSTDAAYLELLFLGEEPDMMFTDPPYGIGFDYNSHDDKDSQKNSDLVEKVFSLVSCGKVWTPGLKNLPRDINRFPNLKVACWYKHFAMMGNGIGGCSTWEPILIFNPSKKGLNNDHIDIQVTKQYLGDKQLIEYHPCPKPVVLYEELISALSNEGEKIYEPFGGSGTTLIACEKINRICFSMEIDPVYCDVILDRWAIHTGQDPMRDDGKMWSEIKLF